MNAALIALDWGTSSLRAYAIAADGSMIGTRSEALGIMQVTNGDFHAALRQCCGDWLDAAPHATLIASGMIGSKQGWLEAPYCACPADAASIARAMVKLSMSDGRTLHIVPGVSFTDPRSGVPDVMRGEETQIIGALPATGSYLAALPGTHSKWVWIESGAIVRFSSWMTGEVYAALSQHTILGRLMQEDAPHDTAAFARGVRYGFAAPAALLHNIFSARTLGLFGTLNAAALPSYLSGMLIGAEIGGALGQARGAGGTDSTSDTDSTSGASGASGTGGGVEATHASTTITLIGSSALTARYDAALTLCGFTSQHGPEDAARLGLCALAAELC